MGKASRVSTQYNANEMDFLAASIAFMESQDNNINAETVTGNMTDRQLAQFNESLSYYRQKYGQQQAEVVD